MTPSRSNVRGAAILWGGGNRHQKAYVSSELTAMIKLIKNHPYTVTSLVFLAVIIAGAILLDWHEDHFAYLLLLYFIITIGIRLDEVVGRLNRLAGSAEETDSAGDTPAAQLAQVQILLKKIHQELRDIRISIDRKMH